MKIIRSQAKQSRETERKQANSSSARLGENEAGLYQAKCQQYGGDMASAAATRARYNRKSRSGNSIGI